MAYGLDMTDESLKLARENKPEAGVKNAEFLEGEIEVILLSDDHVPIVATAPSTLRRAGEGPG
jgi:ubiquinone/menaquinone biosynthesis C-methylase UbiE